MTRFNDKHLFCWQPTRPFVWRVIQAEKKAASKSATLPSWLEKDPNNRTHKSASDQESHVLLTTLVITMMLQNRRNKDKLIRNASSLAPSSDTVRTVDDLEVNVIHA